MTRTELCNKALYLGRECSSRRRKGKGHPADNWREERSENSQKNADVRPVAHSLSPPEENKRLHNSNKKCFAKFLPPRKFL